MGSIQKPAGDFVVVSISPSIETRLRTPFQKTFARVGWNRTHVFRLRDLGNVHPGWKSKLAWVEAVWCLLTTGRLRKTLPFPHSAPLAQPPRATDAVNYTARKVEELNGGNFRV
jgi:hypothetical protein